jgi:hypothetical protein
LSEQRRPNRAHGAIDDLPSEVQLQIRDWYVGRPEAKVPRLTYNQISAQLEAMGHKISYGQVSRWLARQRNELERIEKARERAQSLQKHLVPDGTNIEEAVVALTGALCLEALADADTLQVASIPDLAKVAHAVGTLQGSSVAREKWEQEKRRKIEEAAAQMKLQMQAELEGHPELLGRLLDIAEAAKDKMLEKQA